MYAIAAAILVPLGAVIFVQSTKLMSTGLLRYDSFSACNAETRNASQVCLLKIDIPRRTRGRVFLYYGLRNFYQNMRRYARSRSPNQLMGSRVSVGDLRKECLPCKGGSCDFDFLNRSAPTGNGSFAPFVPCGLIARSYFNDTFTFYKYANMTGEVQVSGKGLAWDVDRDLLFKNGSTRTDAQNALITSEEFMVWMRVAPYRTWYKLHRKILEPLENRSYYLRVESNYPVKSFDGQKYVYFMESTWFGGPNHFLGLANIVVGGLSFILSLLYGIRSKFAPEPQIPPETEVPWTDQDRSGEGSPMK